MPGIRITTPALTPSPSNTSTNSWAKRKCWPRCMRFTRLKFSAKPMAARVYAPKPGKCAICTCWKPPPTCREYGLSTRRRSSTWTARPGSNHTSTVTIAMAICSAVISIGSPRAIGQCPMRILQSILSSGRSWSARSRLTSNRVSRQCAILPGRESPERECWYINMGAVDKSFFSTDAMVRAASF